MTFRIDVHGADIRIYMEATWHPKVISDGEQLTNLRGKYLFKI